MIGDDQKNGYHDQVIELPADPDDSFEARRIRALKMIGIEPDKGPEMIMTDTDKIQKAKKVMADIKGTTEYNLGSMQHDLVILRDQNEKIIRAFNVTMQQFEQFANDMKIKMDRMSHAIFKLSNK